MKRVPCTCHLEDFPAQFHSLLSDAPRFDSSCSAQARVWYIQKDGGYFLKTAPLGALQKEAELTRFYCEKGFAPAVVSYIQTDQDWLLTEKVPGEDCLDRMYLDDPKRLCDTTAQLLRQLHETPCAGCCVDKTADYIATARRNYAQGNYDHSLFPDNWGYKSAQEAWDGVCATAPLLQCDTLLHGDYCLPNIILKDWHFSGFVDLGAGGVGDRHIDLFWGMWSLFFNLKTDAYGQRFLDAYGRDRIEPEILRNIGAFEVFI